MAAKILVRAPLVMQLSARAGPTEIRSFRQKAREALLKTVSWFLFYSRALGLINCFVNHFQPRTNAGSGLVFPFVKRRHARNVQILNYHRVNDDHDPFFPAVPSRLFARQMEYLSSHFHVLGLEEAVERMKVGDVPDNAVVVTLDDGYRDNYVNAFPMLRGLSIPATIFLPTDSISSGTMLWHDRVFGGFRETRVSVLEGFGSQSERYPLRTCEEKLAAQRQVLRFLRRCPDRERSVWIRRLIERLRVVERKEAADLMLTWDQVKVMEEGGIAFGSHTITHPVLSKLPVEKARREIYESKQILEEQLGREVRAFAYPSGSREDFNEVTKSLVREAGYVCGLTAIFGPNEKSQDLFELRRGTPWETYLPAFAGKMNWYKYQSYA